MQSNFDLIIDDFDLNLDFVLSIIVIDDLIEKKRISLSLSSPSVATI